MRMKARQVRWIQRIGYSIALLFLLTGIAYATWYLAHDYVTLRDAYLTQAPFYRSTHWATDFFTPQTKVAGDRYAALGILLALLAGSYLLYSWRQTERHPAPSVRQHISRRDLLALATLSLLQLSLWAYANYLLPPAYDEVFSAMHAAGAGPFRALTYYMLPNNHVSFNVLNGTLFGWWTDDLVLTGRLISLAAYLALGALQYCWLRTLLHDRFAAFALVVLVAVLLPVWGFAAQARGYMLLLLFSWGAFVAVWRYASGRPDSPDSYRGGRMQWLLSGCCLLAYATVPVFLYLHLALLGWISLGWLRARRVDWSLIASQLVAGVGIFLFYLPAISFSGLGAITSNRYVAGGQQGVGEFAEKFLPTLPDYVNYLALDVAAGVPWLLPLLALLPLTFCWARNRAFRRLATFYVLLLSITLATVLLMRAVPFHRTLLFQLQFVGLFIACLPLAGRVFTSTGGSASMQQRPLRWRKGWLRGVAVGWLLLAGGLVWVTPEKFSLHLYYYDIVPTYRSVRGLVEQVPAGARVAGSDEAFYPLYMLRRERHSLTSMPVADYYVKRPGEALPEGGWNLVGQNAEYELYILYIRRGE
ncbi:hypothetical protein [Neolewinella sp.]|uniref:hypothetical protein n=1 Tax=Neolewinella sp. TaxID=2993543 RepID=UPI003B5301E8